jgi:hypothetical protein
MYYKLIKVAAVCRPEQLDPQRFGEMVARNRWVNARVFTSVEDAEKWLMLKPAAPKKRAQDIITRNPAITPTTLTTLATDARSRGATALNFRGRCGVSGYFYIANHCGVSGHHCIPNHCGVSGHAPCLNRRNALHSAPYFGAVIAPRWPGEWGIRPRHAHAGRPGWHR